MPRATSSDGTAQPGNQVGGPLEYVSAGVDGTECGIRMLAHDYRQHYPTESSAWLDHQQPHLRPLKLPDGRPTRITVR